MNDLKRVPKFIWGIILVSIVIGLSACGPQKPKPQSTTTDYGSYTVVCLNGVEYWKFYEFRDGGHAPKYSPGNSAPDTCDQ